MSDGDKPRIGPPVIHITTPDTGHNEKKQDKTDGATGRVGHREVKAYPGAEPIVRRNKKTLSQTGWESRRITLVDGHRSRLPTEQDQLKPLSDDDYFSSDPSDIEVERLKPADIHKLEEMLSQTFLEESFLPDQIMGFAEQLSQDAANFRKISSKVKKRLKSRKYVDGEAKKTLLEQGDNIVQYCHRLDDKLDKVQKAAKQGFSVLQLKSGTSGISYKAADLSIPKGDVPEDEQVSCTDIICDGYKQLLAMSRLWKMEWPSFEILTGIAAAYAGIDLKTDPESPPVPSAEISDEAQLQLFEKLNVMIARLRELERLTEQLKDLTRATTNTESAGVKELLGTIFPDADSRLEPMPMDYYYAKGGHYAQKNRPMDIFEKRLERVSGEISTLRREAEQAGQMIARGKSTFMGPSGQTTDSASEFTRIKEQYDGVEAQWSANFPSVQRIYTERVRGKKRSGK